MTEAEWVASTDPTSMLKFLRGQASDRKLRLYFCGGCRQIAHLFYGPQSLAAVEVAERFVDGKASGEELGEAAWNAESPTFGFEFTKEGLSDSSPATTRAITRLVEMGAIHESGLSRTEWQVQNAVKERLLAAAELAYFCAFRSRGGSESDWGVKFISRVAWPGRWLCDCVFGNPFLQITLNTLWLMPNVVALAQAIYDERAFDRLPILAAALKEAGCDDADILTHCRSPGPHVRGCWVVDLLLGKE